MLIKPDDLTHHHTDLQSKTPSPSSSSSPTPTPSTTPSTTCYVLPLATLHHDPTITIYTA
ncbi:uncharacterized protein BO80DRAFT_426047 [Aspergillus ibericus CBS 121593]|uniref:Uncharacterized protein n=1 Tax=Aspergillus ibericus CBS 121593 TaxID=1448316 RepID=A0A395GWK2_9EURO|nr:hypothetical protein BO80DRAFT_426047 [Aspergillus ibericus CBS 121593]RAK99961.1 hypothetical protein BO80DRAFT_426047 [Aspergillus ibericus CBS 121593]